VGAEGPGAVRHRGEDVTAHAAGRDAAAAGGATSRLGRARASDGRHGADRGKAVARDRQPPSGAGWDSGQVRCRSEGVRARVLTTNSF
jgi:hypothetical protein